MLLHIIINCHSEFHEQWFCTKIWWSDKHHNISFKKLPLGHRDSSWLIALNLFDNFHQEKRSSVSKLLITFRIISSGKSSNFKSDMMQRLSRLVFCLGSVVTFLFRSPGFEYGGSRYFVDKNQELFKIEIFSLSLLSFK